MGNDLLDLTKKIVVLRGGPGSGNWGHTGRPGKLGGSSGGGGGGGVVGQIFEEGLPKNLAMLSSSHSNRIVTKLSKLSTDDLGAAMDFHLSQFEKAVDVGDAKAYREFDVKTKLIERAMKQKIKDLQKQLKSLKGDLEIKAESKKRDALTKEIETLDRLIEKIEKKLKELELETKAALTYKSGSHSGAMIALFLPQEYAGIYTLHHYENALPPDELHITLAYLGKADDLTGGQKNSLHDLMELVSDNHPVLKGAINGVGRFCNGDEEGDPFFIIPDLPQLPNLRELIVLALQGNDIEVSKDHGFVPHITLGYFPHNEPNPFETVERKEIIFPTISLVLGDSRYDYPLGGDMETKAALVTRVGARHTGKEFGLIQQMHDLACDLGATCQAYHKEEKAGAKHSIADMQMIQRIHDDCVMLGAACKVDKTKPPLPVPGMRDLMHKSQLDAPNYRPASELNRCENCVFFKDDPGGDYCQRFDFIADLDYVCDDWQPQKPDEIPGYVGQSLAEIIKGIMELRGGPGSGNWGHTGRPGKLGGSSGGGGLARIGAKPGSTHDERRKASKKHREGRKQKEAKKETGIKLDKFDRAALKRLNESRGGKGFVFGPPTDITGIPGFSISESAREQARQFKRLKDKKLVKETKITSTNARFNITELGKQVLSEKANFLDTKGVMAIRGR